MQKVYFKLHIGVIILLLYSSNPTFVNGNPDTLDTQIGGLKFLSKEVFTSERTSLSLFPECRGINSHFTLSFDCSIYNPKRFGYIFRIFDCKDEGEKPILHLLYNPGVANSEKPGFQLYSALNNTSIDFILTGKKQKNIRIEIHYDNLKREITMRCGDVEKKINNINLNNVFGNIVFGLWGQNTDVAAMHLRNVRFSKSGKTVNFWSLDQAEGFIASDQVMGIQSEVKNPAWLLKQHYHWEKLHNFEADEMVGVVYKEREQEIYFVNKDSLVVYFPFSNNKNVFRYSNERPFAQNEHFSIYNSSTAQIISYDFKFLRSPDGKKTYSILNQEDMTWTPIEETRDWVGNHHHSIFWNQGNEQLTIFGGYANFMYFNEITTYEFATDKWEQPDLTGDSIYPRTHTAIGQNEENGLFYIYGGFGNKEGLQTLGGRTFYDLYELDYQNKKLKKLFDHSDHDFDFVPRGQLLVDPKAEDFYTLGSQAVEKSFLRLYHISLSNESIEAISDSIPVIFTNMAGNVFLFKDEIAQELYCVTRENIASGNSQISIYRLRYPPAHLINNEPTLFSADNTGLIVGFFLIILILALGMMYLRRGKSPYVLRQTEEKTAYSRQPHNAIWLLEGFIVYAPDGADITYRFSQKLKELFILIYFETIHNQGISSKDLSEILWPRMDKNQQKNNRGVTVNHLRKILEDLNGIQLVNKKYKWLFEFQEDFYSDYLELQKALEQKENGINKAFVIFLLSFGRAIPHLSFPWLDKYKANYENHTISTLLDICHNFYQERNYAACLEAAQIIHENFDPLGETALTFKIKALDKMKKPKKAYLEFEQFKKRYFSTYQEEYSRTIAEVKQL